MSKLLIAFNQENECNMHAAYWFRLQRIGNLVGIMGCVCQMLAARANGGGKGEA